MKYPSVDPVRAQAVASWSLWLMLAIVIVAVGVGIAALSDAAAMP